MPRRTNVNAPPKKLKQVNIDSFMSSSPARPSPASKAARVPKPVHRKRTAAPESSPDPPASDDDGDTSDVGAIKFEPEVVVISDSDDDQLQSPRAPKKRCRTRIRRAGSSDEQGKPSENEIDSEVDRGVPVRWKNKGKRPRNRAQITDTDSDQPQRSKHRFIKGARPSSPEDLSDEVDTNKILEPRLRARGKKSAYERNLEKMKRRKRRKRSNTLPSESSDENEDEMENARRVSPFSGSKPAFIDDDEDLSASPIVEDEEEDDNFIVEDSSQAPATELPIQFRNQEDLTYQFKIVCQLFVHLAVCSETGRRRFMTQALKDEYFSASLMLARRKMDGLRDSLVVSSVWRPEFKRPLGRFPNFEITTLDFAVPTCDACRLGSRVSTRLGRISGKAYDRDTFEPLPESDQASDSADENSGEPHKKLARRRRSPDHSRHSDDEVDGSETSEREDLGREVHLGRFCALRARVFHRFMHWEYHLYQALSREVKSLRSNMSGGFVRVAFSGGIRPPDDLSDADGIMDWLDQRGIIEFEWQKVKTLMDSARNLEARAKRGEDAD